VSDEATALPKAILAAPEDDLPRLVYAAWLEHGDALVWRPEQTVKCPELPHLFGPIPCPVCNEEGYVPRPCPPTAQPVTTVTLTTLPDGIPVYTHFYMVPENELSAFPVRPVASIQMEGKVRLRVAGEPVEVSLPLTNKDVLEARWPGVSFKLPAE